MLPEEKTIPAIADSAGTFKTLLAAVTTAELAETLGSEGPFTVFAPTDEAFEKLPKGTVASLLKPENRKQLINILTYHVVSGRVYADQALDAAKAKTLQGQEVSIQLNADGININESSLVAADIQAANGVIHVIDEVLMPTTLNVTSTTQLLEATVRKGAQAFNHGDYHDCADLYLTTCKRIVAEGDMLPEEVPAVLQISLKRAKEKMSEKERAWVLRHGIDLAFYALNH
ncbi:MAG: fasciclin domain-containing protein [Aureliella sp.]